MTGIENVASRRKKSKKSRKNQQVATQTLLKFLDVGGGRKKQAMFDVEKKKKCKYQRKQVSADETEDSSAFEDLVRSSGNYKKVCPACTSVQVFLMSK